MVYVKELNNKDMKNIVPEVILNLPARLILERVANRSA